MVWWFTLQGLLGWLRGGRCRACSHRRRLHLLRGLCVVCVNLERVGEPIQECG